MLYTIAGILLAFWLVGLFTAYTMGGFIHVLFAGALILAVIAYVGDRRVV